MPGSDFKTPTHFTFTSQILSLWFWFVKLYLYTLCREKVDMLPPSNFINRFAAKHAKSLFTIPSYLYLFIIPTYLYLFTKPTYLYLFTIPTFLSFFYHTYLLIFVQHTYLHVFVYHTYLPIFVYHTYLSTYLCLPYRHTCLPTCICSPYIPIVTSTSNVKFGQNEVEGSNILYLLLSLNIQQKTFVQDITMTAEAHHGQSNKGCYNNKL